MKPPKQKLTSEEKAILTAFESGKLRSIPRVALGKKRLQNIAKAHGIKNRLVSLRMHIIKAIHRMNILSFNKSPNLLE